MRYLYEGVWVDLQITKFAGDRTLIVIPSCLEIVVVGETSSINSLKAGCDLPSGTWLVNMSIDLLRNMGVKSINVTDSSRIDGAILKYLRVFYGKFSSWYENFGFVPVEVDIPEVRKAMYDLHHLPASVVDPEAEGYLGPYMMDVWNRDHKEYLALEKYIISDDVPWADLIYTIGKMAFYEYRM